MPLQEHCKMSYCGIKCLYFSLLVWSHIYRSACSYGKCPCLPQGGLQLICKVRPSSNHFLIDFMFHIENMSIFLTVGSAQPDWALTWKGCISISLSVSSKNGQTRLGPYFLPIVHSITVSIFCCQFQLEIQPCLHWGLW